MTIYDLVVASEIAAWWESIRVDEETYLFTDELFQTEQKLGLRIDWITGADGLPVTLKPSAFDVQAIPRPRIGVDHFSAKMPFFKEASYIDEELRQQLLMIIETQNQAYIDLVLKNIFNDEMRLLRGARAQRERMCAMMVTTGTIAIEGNGQVYEYDYHMPEDHKVTVGKSWSDPAAPIMEDIMTAMRKINSDTGVTIVRAITTEKVMGYFRKNEEIRTSLKPMTSGEGLISDSSILQFIKDELKLSIATYDLKYRDEQRKEQRYVPEDVFVLIPDGYLGTLWFGTTPEQADLMSSNVANVSIVDTGVAITTVESTDPVDVNTKVSMICLPDFPTAKQVFIYDVVAEAA